MRIFFSAGEPSGDLHGGNLIRALRAQYPAVECVGFGGERMEAAGCRLHYPLCSLALMGFVQVFLSLHKFVRLLKRAERYFREHRPDAVVLIDFPGFNWAIAKRAHELGIPVYYFVPPQIWAWARWRIKKMQRWVDHVLCSLPFEETWYRQHGVNARYLGHPYFDELSRQRLDAAFVAEEKSRPSQIVALLPGSRTHEVEDNLQTLVRAAAEIHAARPDIRFLVACFKDAHARRIDAYIREHNLPFIQTRVGRTAEILDLARACIAVSGSVGLEMLYRGIPSVVVYYMQAYYVPLVGIFKKVRYISIVNLIADEEIFPELLSPRCEAKAAADHVLGWFNDPSAYQAVTNKLAALREKVAEPGACDRAANYILNSLREDLRASA
jgi:lipid-A-disaccharide synthase